MPRCVITTRRREEPVTCQPPLPRREETRIIQVSGSVTGGTATLGSMQVAGPHGPQPHHARANIRLESGLSEIT